MSSLEATRRALFVALLIGATAALGACNVRPLYGTAPDGSNLRTDLAAVDVAPIEGRVGQKVRNELLLLLNGGAAAAPDYLVDLDVNRRDSSIIVRRVTGQPQGRTVTLNVRFTLREHGGDRPLYGGRVTRHASYERSNQRFANDRAEIDAENRAAREAAEEIRMRLAAYFASDGRVSETESPDIDDELDEITDFDDDDLLQ